MITREDIKRAIDGIAARDAEVARKLDEMLAEGRIDSGALDGEYEGWSVTFLGKEEPVRRYLFFQHGPPAVAERLLVKYGERLRRQALERSGSPDDWGRAGREVRRAGPEFLVNHLLVPGHFKEASLPWQEDDPRVLFKGVVDLDTPALFTRFPLCRDALLQVAARNLEFFSVGAVLELIKGGAEGRLLAAVIRGRIEGLLLLDRRKELLEVRYIASAQSGRGIGALLLAGAWLLWRIWEPGLARLVLDSELSARHFYASSGFELRGAHEFVLKSPRGHLLRNLVCMANHRADLPERVRSRIEKAVRRETRNRARVPEGEGTDGERLQTALLFEECFRARNRRGFAREAARALVRYGQGKPLCERILRSAAEYGLVQEKAGVPLPTRPLLVVLDERFAGHLKKVTHLESGRRLRALQEVLDEPDLAGRWRKVAPRQASVEELGWVHSAAHVRRIAETAGRPLTQLDGETVASEESWDVARLAVGGVFNLLDEIQKGTGKRGFAFVRPPGHHAEPDRAMGFCLFNNVALGAEHLLRRHGFSRVLIVDLDVHHGNGTQRAFYGTDRVLFVSFHHQSAFPFTGVANEVGDGVGEGYTVNVPLPGLQGDGDMVRIVHRIVGSLARQYRPEMVLVSCGFDLYVRDPLGEMNVTPEGYGMLAAVLIEIADEVCEGRLAFIMEGGYSVRGIRECGRRVLLELSGVRGESRDRLSRILKPRRRATSALKTVLEIQEPYWDLDTPDAPLTPHG